ncbi:exodeoxyribonuclease VII small subunit [Leptospira sp. GIMC2001]|uniref:exodeoxyribonuclease VII small subunit n=1 Tax=Leptospira sp. GIMC2001 TaxID=1513297 RepID=UPI0023492512|nr:exodeoxyribonuclease VII small subunit [Leptospira sp. GIMC2001]WCL50951.1 exodeoxyribonuclease VII small subunit [Leptospira sp. GIMC2001]
MKNKTEDLSFEEAIQELEEIAEKLEKGQISLEDSILAYERGVELKKICTNRLKEADTRIEILNKAPDGSAKKETATRKTKKSDTEETEELF